MRNWIPPSLRAESRSQPAGGWARAIGGGGKEDSEQGPGRGPRGPFLAPGLAGLTEPGKPGLRKAQVPPGARWGAQGRNGRGGIKGTGRARPRIFERRPAFSFTNLDPGEGGSQRGRNPKGPGPAQKGETTTKGRGCHRGRGPPPKGGCGRKKPRGEKAHRAKFPGSPLGGALLAGGPQGGRAVWPSVKGGKPQVWPGSPGGEKLPKKGTRGPLWAGGGTPQGGNRQGRPL